MSNKVLKWKKVGKESQMGLEYHKVEKTLTESWIVGELFLECHIYHYSVSERWEIVVK